MMEELPVGVADPHTREQPTQLLTASYPQDRNQRPQDRNQREGMKILNTLCASNIVITQYSNRKSSRFLWLYNLTNICRAHSAKNSS